MAVHTTDATGTDFSPNLWLYYEKKLLSTLEPRLRLQPLGKPQRLPKGMGVQVKWLRYDAVAANTTPLTEGTPPSETALNTSNVTADVKQYGDFAKVSDLLSDTAIDPVIKNMSERFGRAAAKTIESLIIAELDAEAAIQHVNNRADDTAHVAGDVLNHKEIIEAMIEQKRAFIEPHESGSYVCCLNPASEFDIISDNSNTGSYLDIRKFDRAEDLLQGEIGRMYGVRFVVSDLMSSIASGADDPNETGTDLAAVKLFNSYMIGSEAYGVVQLDGRSVRMIMKKHGSGGTSDPLDQFATVGYKVHGFVAKYLDSGSKRVIRMKASSALS